MHTVASFWAKPTSPFEGSSRKSARILNRYVPFFLLISSIVPGNVFAQSFGEKIRFGNEAEILRNLRPGRAYRIVLDYLLEKDSTVMPDSLPVEVKLDSTQEQVLQFNIEFLPDTQGWTGRSIPTIIDLPQTSSRAAENYVFRFRLSGNSGSAEVSLFVLPVSETIPGFAYSNLPATPDSFPFLKHIHLDGNDPERSTLDKFFYIPPGRHTLLISDAKGSGIITKRSRDGQEIKVMSEEFMQLVKRGSATFDSRPGDILRFGLLGKEFDATAIIYKVDRDEAAVDELLKKQEKVPVPSPKSTPPPSRKKDAPSGKK